MKVEEEMELEAGVVEVQRTRRSVRGSAVYMVPSIVEERVTTRALWLLSVVKVNAGTGWAHTVLRWLYEAQLPWGQALAWTEVQV